MQTSSLSLNYLPAEYCSPWWETSQCCLLDWQWASCYSDNPSLQGAGDAPRGRCPLLIRTILYFMSSCNARKEKLIPKMACLHCKNLCKCVCDDSSLSSLPLYNKPLHNGMCKHLEGTSGFFDAILGSNPSLPYRQLSESITFKLFRMWLIYCRTVVDKYSGASSA